MIYGIDTRRRVDRMKSSLSSSQQHILALFSFMFDDWIGFALHPSFVLQLSFLLKNTSAIQGIHIHLDALSSACVSRRKRKEKNFKIQFVTCAQ